MNEETIIDTVIESKTMNHLAITDMELSQLITGLSEILVKRTQTLERQYTLGHMQDMQTCVFLIGKCHQLFGQKIVKEPETV